MRRSNSYDALPTRHKEHFDVRQTSSTLGQAHRTDQELPWLTLGVIIATCGLAGWAVWKSKHQTTSPVESDKADQPESTLTEAALPVEPETVCQPEEVLTDVTLPVEPTYEVQQEAFKVDVKPLEFAPTDRCLSRKPPGCDLDESQEAIVTGEPLVSEDINLDGVTLDLRSLFDQAMVYALRRGCRIVLVPVCSGIGATVVLVCASKLARGRLTSVEENYWLNVHASEYGVGTSAPFSEW